MVKTGGVLTAGKLNKLTGAMLRKTLKPHLHPKLEEDMQGAGLFDKLSSIINMGNIKRLYGTIDKGIKVGTKGYNAYRDIKKGVDGMKKKDEVDTNAEVQKLQMGAGLKSKRKLPEKLRKRAEYLGKMMKKGHSMKKASEMYEKENN
jgi:hypothetical protein